MSEQSSFGDVDGYMEQFAGETRGRLETIRNLVRTIAPEATERISYGIPAAFIGRHVIVYFSGYANHVSVYPGRVITDLDDELKPYLSGKSTLKFVHANPLPVDIIERYIMQRYELAKKEERK